jgi:glyoxylase-like metal-dependent hydrolase (beta-lactamase superfamily II)
VSPGAAPVFDVFNDLRLTEGGIDMTHYRIRVLEVGYVSTYPADFSFDGFHLAGESIFNPFSMTLLQGEGRNILIDSGIDLRNPAKREIFRAAGAECGHSPDEVLAAVGLRPEDIDAIILTHLHWDHASGLACFPDAEIYLQKEELEEWERITADPAYSAVFVLSMDIRDMGAIRELEAKGRVRLLDGECDDLFPGLHIRVSRFSHSFAHQLVLVENARGLYVIAGDLIYRPENLFGTKAFPHPIPNLKFAVGAPVNTVKDYKRVLAWADGDASRIVMTHDGTRNGRFPVEKSALGLSVYEICP